MSYNIHTSSLTLRVPAAGSSHLLQGEGTMACQFDAQGKLINPPQKPCIIRFNRQDYEIPVLENTPAARVLLPGTAGQQVQISDFGQTHKGKGLVAYRVTDEIDPAAPLIGTAIRIR